MADTPRPWAILEAAQLRLQGIHVADGFRTDAGDDVRLEPSADALVAPRITLYTAALVRPDGAPSKAQREFTLVVEAAVPTSIDNAHRAVVDIAEDIEQAIGNLALMPGALPLEFQESLFLDRPDGMPAMCVQLMFTTEFRR